MMFDPILLFTGKAEDCEPLPFFLREKFQVVTQKSVGVALSIAPDTQR